MQVQQFKKIVGLVSLASDQKHDSLRIKVTIPKVSKPLLLALDQLQVIVVWNQYYGHQYQWHHLLIFQTFLRLLNLSQSPFKCLTTQSSIINLQLLNNFSIYCSYPTHYTISLDSLWYRHCILYSNAKSVRWVITLVLDVIKMSSSTVSFSAQINSGIICQHQSNCFF